MPLLALLHWLTLHYGIETDDSPHNIMRVHAGDLVSLESMAF